MSITMTVTVCLIVIISTLFIAVVTELLDKLRTNKQIKYVVYIAILVIVFTNTLLGLVWLVNHIKHISV